MKSNISHLQKSSVWSCLFLVSALVVACNKKSSDEQAPSPLHQQVQQQAAIPAVTIDRSACVDCFEDGVTLSNVVNFQSVNSTAALAGSFLVQGSLSQEELLSLEGISLTDPMALVKYHGPTLVFGSLRNQNAFSMGSCTVPAGDFILRPRRETKIVLNVIQGAALEAVHSSGARFTVYLGKMIPYTPAQNVSVWTSLPPQRISFSMTLSGAIDHDCGVSIPFVAN